MQLAAKRDGPRRRNGGRHAREGRFEINVTVCELSDEQAALEGEWDELAQHCARQGSQLVLLPEMPFFPWIASTSEVDGGKWRAAVEAHVLWLGRLAELGVETVLGSRPVIRDEKPLNEGFVWNRGAGHLTSHAKYYLPDEESFWEASWYERGDLEFRSTTAGEAKVGFTICTELWFTEHAREYARQGVHLLVCPRATEARSVDKWIAGGRAAAVMSGAYCISSNRSGRGSGIEWGGAGWIIDPDGEVLGVTSADQRYLSLDLSLEAAESAKQSYPRYVAE